MKKTKLLALLVLPLLVSCNTNKVRVDNGTEAAKILLANERLDASVLTNSDGLFTKGKQAFAKILNETRKYSVKYAGRPNETYTEIEGNTIKWYNDVEYSNFNSFFESYTVNIEYSAIRGGDLIDSTKRNIRVVNKWVKLDDTEYLLTVDETSETIFYRSQGQVEMCKRYTDDAGHDVYEMYIQNENASTRMKYVPGLVYEYTINSNGYNHYLFAENYKGFWTVNSVGDMQSYTLDDSVTELISFSTMILKEEACYQFSTTVYNDKPAEINTVQIISSDHKTDLLTINTDTFVLYNTGIKGLDYLTIEASPEERNEFYNDHEKDKNTVVYEQVNIDNKGNYYTIYSTSGKKSATAVLESGKTFTEGSTFANGQVVTGRIDVGYAAGCDSYGIIPFYTRTGSLEENFNLIKQFLNETGISFRRDLQDVLDSAEFALNDAPNFAKYYQWNGYSVNDIEEVKLAIKAERKKSEDLQALYEIHKDKQVISYYDQKAMNENMYFADVILTKDMVINNDGFTINLLESEVKVEDTLLFVDKENYKLVLAFESEDGTIIPLLDESNSFTSFNSEQEFILSQELTTTIPELEIGKYTLVAYVATYEEGIRVTKPVKVSGTFTQATNSATKINQQITTNADKNLILVVSGSNDVYETITKTLKHDELEHTLAEIAYQYGSLDKELVIEEYKNNAWSVVEVKDTYSSGQYRLKYQVNDSNTTGYVYVTIKN